MSDHDLPHGRTNMIREYTRPEATFLAVQWDGTNLADIAELAGDAVLDVASGLLCLQLADGPAVAKPGWWVRREAGALHICNDTVMRDEHWRPAP